MKKFSVLYILCILILQSCNDYTIEDNKVYYTYWNEGSGKNKIEIKEADAKSFKTLDFECDCSFKFGKDKNHLFIDGIKINNIDPTTFEFIGNYIFRDKNSAYFFGFYNDINDCLIKGVNPDKINLISYPWAKANNILIHGKDTVSIDDMNDFIPLDEDWGKTKKHIINKNKILYGADLETFKIVNSFEGKDENYNYTFGYIDDNIYKKVSYKSFDFDEIDLCKLKPVVFVDLYDKLEPFIDSKNENIIISEKLKLKGFAIKNIRQSNSGESKIISLTLTKNQCNCYVEKKYQYDYSKPDEGDKIYKITERLHCDK